MPGASVRKTQGFPRCRTLKWMQISMDDVMRANYTANIQKTQYNCKKTITAYGNGGWNEYSQGWNKKNFVRGDTAARSVRKWARWCNSQTAMSPQSPRASRSPRMVRVRAAVRYTSLRTTAYPRAARSLCRKTISRWFRFSTSLRRGAFIMGAYK